MNLTFFKEVQALKDWGERIATYLGNRRLSLHPEKTIDQLKSVPAEFLGFVLLQQSKRRLQAASIPRLRNWLRGLRDRWRAGTGEIDEVERRVHAWVAHAKHADTCQLRRAVFSGVIFDSTAVSNSEQG